MTDFRNQKAVQNGRIHRLVAFVNIAVATSKSSSSTFNGGIRIRTRQSHDAPTSAAPLHYQRRNGIERSEIEFELAVQAIAAHRFHPGDGPVRANQFLGFHIQQNQLIAPCVEDIAIQTIRCDAGPVAGLFEEDAMQQSEREFALGLGVGDPEFLRPSAQRLTIEQPTRHSGNFDIPRESWSHF